MIISTKYPDLVKFIKPTLRQENEVPMMDGFLLTKDLVHNDLRRLENFNRYLVVSKFFFDFEWGRQEIVDECIKSNGSRRKPKFDWMGDPEFIEAVKIFYVCGYWPEDEQEEVVYELFKNINSFKRYELYFALRETLSPNEILYSVLTFVRRCFNDNSKFEVSPGYLRIIESKRALIKQNFSKAIKRYVQLDAENDFKVVMFISILGEVNH